MHNLNPPIFHRDIKPENILLTGTESKLADFGCSNLIDDERMTYCGTPDYIAPEMIMGECQNEKVFTLIQKKLYKDYLKIANCLYYKRLKIADFIFT